MIKRERIQRVLVHKVEDGQGGSTISYEDKEYVEANVSIISTYGDITQYGITDEMVIHATTAYYLDESANARYKYSGKYFKVLRQIKVGNEYFCVMKQVEN